MSFMPAGLSPQCPYNFFQPFSCTFSDISDIFGQFENMQENRWEKVWEYCSNNPAGINDAFRARSKQILHWTENVD